MSTPSPSAPTPTHHLRPPPRTPPSSPPARPPAVLLLTGSLSPITHMHLRLLELARDTLRARAHPVLGGYISPAPDTYPKPALLPAHHRLRMARLALEHAPWLAVDPWEAVQPRFVRTHEVAARVARAARDIGFHDALVFLVCGADLLHAMADPAQWPPQSVDRLFANACVIWARRDPLGGQVFEPDGKLSRFRDRAIEMKGFTWGISSTAVRDAVRNHCSILYMTPKPVVDYIVAHKLFLCDGDRKLDHNHPCQEESRDIPPSE